MPSARPSAPHSKRRLCHPQPFRLPRACCRPPDPSPATRILPHLEKFGKAIVQPDLEQNSLARTMRAVPSLGEFSWMVYAAPFAQQ